MVLGAMEIGERNHVPLGRITLAIFIMTTKSENVVEVHLLTHPSIIDNVMWESCESINNLGSGDIARKVQSICCQNSYILLKIFFYFFLRTNPFARAKKD